MDRAGAGFGRGGDAGVSTASGVFGLRGGRGDLIGGAVLTTCSLPYAFLAGFGAVQTDYFHGLGRTEFTTGSAAVLVVAVASLLGLGRRIEAPVAGVVVGLCLTTTGLLMALLAATPFEAAAVLATVCAMAVGFLPALAVRAVRFPVEPPVGGLENVEFDDEPVNVFAVTERVVRVHEVLTGLIVGLGTLLALSIAVLVFPITAMGTSPRDSHTVWEQALAGLVATGVLCRVRMFRRRGQVLGVAVSGIVGLALVGASLSLGADEAARSTWVPAVLVLAGAVGFCLSTLRVRRGTDQAFLSPMWAHFFDLFEVAVYLAMVPVMCGVLGLYGTAQALSSG